MLKAVCIGLLGLASIVQAQEPVLLRLNPYGGLDTARFRTEVETWLSTPLLPQGDAALPTFRVGLYSTRIVTRNDSVVVFADLTDSSRFDMPRIRDVQPQLATSGDFLRGLRTETRLDPRGRTLSTRITAAPGVPSDLPVLIRGMQSLAIAGLRLSTLSLPGEPVSPGDMWTDSVRFDLGADAGLAPSFITGGGAGLATFRFDALEMRAGARVAILTAVAQINIAGQDPGAATSAMLAATARMEVLVETGRVIRSLVEMSGPMASRVGTIPVRLRLSMQELPAR